MSEFTVTIKSDLNEENHIYPMDDYKRFRRLYRELNQRLEAGQHETVFIGSKYLVRASIWYVTHQNHVDRIIPETKTKYPPTDEYDVRNPNVWKPEHWKWFIEEHL